MTRDVQGGMENLVAKDVMDPKVMKDSRLVVMVHLETGALLETSGPQDLLDLKEILENLVLTAVQDRADAKEIQAIGGTLVTQVWLAPLVPGAVGGSQVFLVNLGLTVLQASRAALDCQVLLDRWDFTDWTD